MLIVLLNDPLRLVLWLLSSLYLFYCRVVLGFPHFSGACYLWQYLSSDCRWSAILSLPGPLHDLHQHSQQRHNYHPTCTHTPRWCSRLPFATPIQSWMHVNWGGGSNKLPSAVQPKWTKSKWKRRQIGREMSAPCSQSQLRWILNELLWLDVWALGQVNCRHSTFLSYFIYNTQCDASPLTLTWCHV